VCADGAGVLRAVSLKGAMPGDFDEEEEEDGDDEPAAVGTVVATSTSPARHGAPLASGGPAALGMRPAVSHLAISPDGAWVAAATSGKGGGGKGAADAGPSSAVELFSLPGLEPHGPLLLVDPLAMPPPLLGGASDDDDKPRRHAGNKAAAAAAAALPPVTALAFSPDSRTLAVATAGNAVAAYDARARAPTAWTRRYAAAAAELLGALPGAVAGLSFGGGLGDDGGGGSKGARGAFSSSLVAYSPGGVCALDLGAPVGAGHLRGGGGGGGGGGHHARHRRGAAKPPREGPGSAGVPPGASARGVNGRVLLLENPCLFFGHAAADVAVLLERPLSALLAGLPPPLQRARYGS